MESDSEVEEIVVDESTEQDGPWAILLCGLAGLIGLVINWFLGNQTLSSYLSSCAVFAALMYAILWVSGRSTMEMENGSNNESDS